MAAKRQRLAARRTVATGTVATGTVASAVDERRPHIEQRRQEQAGITVLADDMTTIAVLQLLGWVAGTVAASPVMGGFDTDEQQRLARAVASPSRVDARVIDHIVAMLRHCQLQEDALGSRAVVPMALAQRDLVRGLLAECPAMLRSRLLSIYSDLSTSIGYYFFELDDINNARRYYEQAWVAAHNAGSVELGIYALCEWSYTESWQGQAPTGLDLPAAAKAL